MVLDVLRKPLWWKQAILELKNIVNLILEAEDGLFLIST